MLSTPVSNSS